MRRLILVLFLSFCTILSCRTEDNFLEGSVKFDEITETIYLESPMSFKYDTGYREISKMSAKEELSKTIKKDQNALFQKGDLTLESTYKKDKTSYFTDKLENKQMIKYNNNKLVLSAGISNNYEYSNIFKSTRKLFFSPELRVNDHIILGFNNMLNIDSKTFEHGASIRYKPYFLKNTSFGLNGSIKQKENDNFARKFEFTSEFYLW